MTGFQPPNWKKLAQTRMRAKLEPRLHNLKKAIEALEELGIRHPLIHTGLSDIWFSAIRSTVEEEKRYTSQRYLDAIVTEWGLRDLVNPEEIRKFEFPVQE